MKVIDKSTIKAAPIAELPEDQYQSALGTLQKMLEGKGMSEYTVWPKIPDTSNYAAYQDYATVTVGGKVVATLDNQGCLTTGDAMGNAITQALAGIDKEASDAGITQGPALAQFRADRIAAMLGGKVTKLPTAIKQSQFDVAPKIDPDAYKPWVDRQALKNDPLYTQIEDLKAQRAAYLAQQTMQSPTATAA